MSVEHHEPHEPLDSGGDLGVALRAAADSFAPGDPLALVSSGHLKGRRMRRRRAVGVVAGATALAAVAVGGVTAGAWLNGDSNGTRQSGVAAAAHGGRRSGPPAVEVTRATYPEVLAGVLASMVPPGVQSHAYGNSTPDLTGMDIVSLTTRGSNTKTLLSMGIRKSIDSGGFMLACQSKDTKKWGLCSLTTDKNGKLPRTWDAHGHSRPVAAQQTKVNGGTLTVYRTLPKSGERPVTVLAIFEGHGYVIDVTETPLIRRPQNQASNPTSFTNKLTDEQLVSIVTDQRWAKLVKDRIDMLTRHQQAVNMASGATPSPVESARALAAVQKH